uniref:Uncharacterized protein n=1 Tax=Plectus sambesii TaxID=2011161 RepID=A0A914XD82_9BILA
MAFSQTSTAKLTVSHPRSACSLGRNEPINEELANFSAPSLSCNELTERALDELDRRRCSLFDHHLLLSPLHLSDSTQSLVFDVPTRPPVLSEQQLKDAMPVVCAQNEIFECECGDDEERAACKDTADSVRREEAHDCHDDSDEDEDDVGRVLLIGTLLSRPQSLRPLSFRPSSIASEKELKKKWQFPSIRQPTGWRRPKRDSEPKVAPLKRTSLISVSPQSSTCKSRKPSCPSFSLINSRLNTRVRTLEWGLDGSSDSLPDVLAEVLQHNGGLSSGRNSLTPPDVQSLKPQLVKPKWEDLEVWSDEVEAWSMKHADLKLSKSDKKKQDVIYELYITEKHHCQVIIVLQQAYQVRLREERVISDKDLDLLIPDVLDGLLDFHLNLLRRIRQKQARSPIVDTICDIINEEFASGERRQSAIDAYTRFCSMKEDAGRVFVDLKSRNVQFRNFFERYENDPEYKERSFKSCLLLITQRLTKYPLLTDQLYKYESSENKELAQAAATAVKRFAGTVDNGLARIEIHRRWDHIQKMLDRSSIAMLHGKRFTYDDLVAYDNDRKVLCIGTVLWQNAVQKPEQVLMILFDDIIIFLINKGGRYHFFSQDKHEPVISLKSLLIREKVRSTAVLLIVAPPAKPDMYEIMFNTKQEMKQWQAALSNAHAHAQPVRRIREEISLPEKGSNGGVGDEEQQNIAEIAKWMEEMTALFTTRGVEEHKLKEYMIRRMEWFDQVRRHLKAYPCRSKADVPERIKLLVRDKFRELRASRRTALTECVKLAQKTRDDDLPSFFDDAFDAGAEVDWSASDNSDAEDARDTRPTRAKLPRRIQTFHGTGDNLESK